MVPREVLKVCERGKLAREIFGASKCCKSDRSCMSNNLSGQNTVGGGEEAIRFFPPIILFFWKQRVSAAHFRLFYCLFFLFVQIWFQNRQGLVFFEIFRLFSTPEIFFGPSEKRTRSVL